MMNSGVIVEYGAYSTLQTNRMTKIGNPNKIIKNKWAMTIAMSIKYQCLFRISSFRASSNKFSLIF